MSTLTAPDTDLFNSFFTTDGTWALINQKMRQQCVGTFSSEQDAESFRNTYLPSYLVVQIVDPSDVAREQGRGEQRTE